MRPNQNRRHCTTLRIPRNELAAIKTLNQNQVEYLLIGGYAMRFYGALPCPKDVDLLTNNSPENAGRLFDIIRDLLGYTPRFTVSELADPRKKLDLTPHGYLLDILTSVDGLDFETAFRKGEVAFQRGIAVPVAAKEHLLFIKRTAAARDESRREKELRDIEFLESLGT